MNLPGDFLQEEDRCDFRVSQMMKRLWAASMELLEVIADICKKNDLTYYADAGTLLGAVRHQGFIPWDDDIDISMKRQDYNRLISILPSQLPHGYAIAGMYAKEERLQETCRTLQLRVITDEKQWDLCSYMKKFYGFPYPALGIDIFPLDYIPADQGTREWHNAMVQHSLAVASHWNQLEQSGELGSALDKLEELCGLKLDRSREDLCNQTWILADRICSMFSEWEAEELGIYPYCVHSTTSYHMKKEWYDDVVYLPFESIEVAAPVNYKGVLEHEFGEDYMTPRFAKCGHNYPVYASVEEAFARKVKNSGFPGTVDQFCEMVYEGKLEF